MGNLPGTCSNHRVTSTWQREQPKWLVVSPGDQVPHRGLDSRLPPFPYPGHCGSYQGRLWDLWRSKEESSAERLSCRSLPSQGSSSGCFPVLPLVLPPPSPVACDLEAGKEPRESGASVFTSLVLGRWSGTSGSLTWL